jgi:hypothetical protein
VALNLMLIPLFQVRGAVFAWIATMALFNVVYARALRSCVAPRLLLSGFGAYGVAVGCGLGAGLLCASLPLSAWVPGVAALVVFLIAALATGLVNPTTAAAFIPGRASSRFWGGTDVDTEP